MDRVSAVTIARVQGHAIGGGLLLALACDFRLAAEGTVFFVPEVDLASPLDWRGVPRLIRAVGATRAKEMVIMCQRVDAAQAERWGLVNRCVPADQLDREMADWTQRLIGKPELVLRLCKAQFRAYGATLPLGDASQFETSLLLESLADERARASFGLG
jgi:enoyl-CoA hydratase/carnithine racemase